MSPNASSTPTHCRTWVMRGGSICVGLPQGLKKAGGNMAGVAKPVGLRAKGQLGNVAAKGAVSA